jgi:hypothetical protein
LWNNRNFVNHINQKKRKMKKTVIITAIITAFFMSQQGFGQMVGTPYILPALPPPCYGSTTEGTEFWTTFGDNAGNPTTQVFLVLKIAATDTATVTLNFTEDGSTAVYHVASNSVTTINMQNVAGNVSGNLGDKRDAVYLGSTYTNASGTVNKTLKITSTTPVSVYAFNCGTATSDAAVILPVGAWGTDYYRLSYRPASILPFGDCEMIIARESGTIVTTPSGNISLSPGQVYYNLSNNTDMTGRHVTSNKPVAYFTQNTDVEIPHGTPWADVLFEQLMPVNQWGTRFMIPNAEQESNLGGLNRIRIIAAEAGTVVNFTGATVQTGFGNAGTFGTASGGTLNAGQWVEFLFSGSAASSATASITATKPVGVAAYMTASDRNQNSGFPRDGDPSICWIPPLEQSVPSVIISPFLFPVNYSNNTGLDASTARHYMIIITETATRNQTVVERRQGASVTSTPVTSGWTADTGSGYSRYTQTFSNTADLNAVFKVSNPTGIIVLCGGLADQESYYYNAGSGACVINQ